MNGTVEEHANLDLDYTPRDQAGHLTDNMVQSWEPGNRVTANAWYEHIA
jgi:hypothetical protein